MGKFKTNEILNKYKMATKTKAKMNIPLLSHDIHACILLNIKYCSTWVALAIFGQIINLIHNFWISNFLFIFENFGICVYSNTIR